MMSYRFSRWLTQQHNITSGFVVSDVTLFRSIKSVCRPKPNYVDISQSTAVITLLPVWKKNKRPPYWNSPISISTTPPPSALSSHSTWEYQISFKSDHPRRSYVCSRRIDFQDGSCGGTILLPASYLLTSLSSKGQKLFANKISSTYLNPQLR